jgi:hypothetical protein
MRKMIKLASCGLLVLLTACSGMMRTAPVAGDTADVVKAKFGAPTAVYPLADGQVYEYATGPLGQYTWMATLGPDGRLVSFEQVLSERGYGRIKIDVSTKADVLRTLGRPAETSFVAMHNYEVWSYRYKESDVWNSMMHVHFDRGGVVRLMQNGPDPMYEKSFFRE